MKKEKPSIGDYFKTPNPGLWAYFKHNVSGQPEDYRPPFWNKMERSKVLELWQERLDALSIKRDLPSLYDFEMDMKSKVGPMSIQLPLDQRIESIENYFTCIDKASEPISEEAIAATKKFFSKAGGIRLRDRRNVIKNMRLSTNSGCWLFTKRRKVVEETTQYRVEREILAPNFGYDGIHVIPIASSFKQQFPNYKLCAVLGWRGQEGGLEVDDVKQRVVWMMPFLLNIEELTFYQPAIEAMQKNGLIPAYVSMDAVDQEVTALFDTKGDNDLVICTDFSKFDQHFNEDLQNAACDIIHSLMTNAKFDYSKVRESKFTNDLQCDVHDFLPTYHSIEWLHEIFPVKYNIPLMCSEDLMYSGKHGMGSGSGGTNFDECMAHKALQFESALDNHSQLNPHSMAYGDDGILTYPGITVDKVIQSYTRHGLEMNASKQYVSTHDCVVLRRWHGKEYRVNGTMVGVYSTFRALGRLLAQERYYDPEKWSANLVTLRALSILENCKWHPAFHEFIEFVISGDKYKLGLAIPGFFDSLESIAKEATENFTDFLGYTKSLQRDTNDKATGINDWEVIKYLKSKLE